ncbi:MAG TPA: hypothetical protein V6D26_02660, partial [Stenomitos sp.]
MTEVLLIKERFCKNNSVEPEMDAFIPFEDKNTLHPEQWVKVYGIHSEQYYYIITCQVFQLDAVLGGNQATWWADWWDGFLLEAVDEGE